MVPRGSRRATMDGRAGSESDEAEDASGAGGGPGTPAARPAVDSTGPLWRWVPGVARRAPA